MNKYTRAPNPVIVGGQEFGFTGTLYTGDEMALFVQAILAQEDPAKRVLGKVRLTAEQALELHRLLDENRDGLIAAATRESMKKEQEEAANVGS